MKGCSAELEWHCPTCPKSFSRKGDLTRHKLLHAGIKRHVCAICKKAFSQYSGLKTHKNVHTKVKPFVCGFNHCSASFGDPSSCARHRKETHRRMGAYRCPYPLCKSSIKRRSAFAAHLKKHNIDVTYMDIDAMAPPLLPVVVSVPRRESVQEITVIDVMPQRSSGDQQAVGHARHTCSEANESTLHQFPHHQTSISWPWTHYDEYSGTLADPSLLSTLPPLPILDHDSLNWWSMDSSAVPNSPVNLISSSPTKLSFEITLPDEPVIKTEDKIVVNVPRTFDSLPCPGDTCLIPFPIYPDFKPYDFSWIQPT